MNKEFSIPPKSPDLLTASSIIATRLAPLISKSFELTDKARTNGSNLRKLVAQELENHSLIDSADIRDYEIIPPKGKGVPKIRREFLDTYVVPTDGTYNMQVWNRIPNSKSILIQYNQDRPLRAEDVRFVLVRIDSKNNIVKGVLVLSPDYIESNFGKFGKQTVKQQLIISNKKREEVKQMSESTLFHPDTQNIQDLGIIDTISPSGNFQDDPQKGGIISLSKIKELFVKELIGKSIKPSQTKNRGQELELICLNLLGYNITKDNFLEGGFPDIKNQLIEVKIQDSPTVDLGRYSPASEEIIFSDLNITTLDIRYIIALTNPQNGIIEGLVITPGKYLGNYFTYVSDESYKCQRSITINKFDKYLNQSVFNPEIGDGQIQML